MDSVVAVSRVMQREISPLGDQGMHGTRQEVPAVYTVHPSSSHAWELEEYWRKRDWTHRWEFRGDEQL
jgi:hypothetical protein